MQINSFSMMLLFLNSIFIQSVQCLIDYTKNDAIFLKIDNPIQNITRNINQSAKIMCEITGNPIPNYKWFHNNKQLISGNRINIKSTLWGSRLRIKMIRKDDFGKYTCEATNSDQILMSHGYIFVENKFYQTNPEKSIKVDTKEKCQKYKNGICHKYLNQEKVFSSKKIDIADKLHTIKNTNYSNHCIDTLNALICYTSYPVCKNDQKILPCQDSCHKIQKVCDTKRLSFVNCTQLENGQNCLNITIESFKRKNTQFITKMYKRKKERSSYNMKIIIPSISIPCLLIIINVSILLIVRRCKMKEISQESDYIQKTLCSITSQYNYDKIESLDDLIHTKDSNMRQISKIVTESIKIIKKLGYSSFGRVFTGQWVHTSQKNSHYTVHENVLIKLLDNVNDESGIKGEFSSYTLMNYQTKSIDSIKSIKNGVSPSNLDLKSRIFSEARSNMKIKNDYFSQLLGIGGTGTLQNPYFLVYQFTNNMSFQDYLGTYMKESSHYSSFHAYKINIQHKINIIKILQQIGYALCYLKENNYIHRDISARNVLLNDRMEAKLGDFASCCQKYRHLYLNVTSMLFPVKWMSPESLLCHEFSHQSDIWSYGVMTWEALNFGQEPYAGIENEDCIELIHQGVGPGYIKTPSSTMQLQEQYTFNFTTSTPEKSSKVSTDWCLRHLNMLHKDCCVQIACNRIQSNQIIQRLGIVYANLMDESKNIKQKVVLLNNFIAPVTEPTSEKFPLINRNNFTPSIGFIKPVINTSKSVDHNYQDPKCIGQCSLNMTSNMSNIPPFKTSPTCSLQVNNQPQTCNQIFNSDTSTNREFSVSHMTSDQSSFEKCNIEMNIPHSVNISNQMDKFYDECTNIDSNVIKSQLDMNEQFRQDYQYI